MKLWVQRSSSSVIRAPVLVRNSALSMSYDALMMREMREAMLSDSAQLGCLDTGGRSRLQVPPTRNQSVISS